MLDFSFELIRNQLGGEKKNRMHLRAATVSGKQAVFIYSFDTFLVLFDLLQICPHTIKKTGLKEEKRKTCRGLDLNQHLQIYRLSALPAELHT